MPGESASLWTKVQDRINGAIAGMIGFYTVTSTDGSAITIDVDDTSRTIAATRGVDIRPGDLAIVLINGREMYAIAAVAGGS